MAHTLCLLALLAGLALPGPGGALGAEPPDAPNGVLLVAQPSLADPNFREAVVLVTQAGDTSTVGVILNRPSPLEVARFFGPEVSTRHYRDRVYVGGPVMREQVVALFLSDAAPPAPAFHVLKGLYLTMHPKNIEALLADPAARYRLYAGFSGWAPRQLGRELALSAWHVLPADAHTVLRADTTGLWEELVARVASDRAGIGPRTPALAARR